MTCSCVVLLIVFFRLLINTGVCVANRSMSESLEAVARAVHFSGMGKAVTQAVANARHVASIRERRGGSEGAACVLRRQQGDTKT